MNKLILALAMFVTATTANAQSLKYKELQPAMNVAKEACLTSKDRDACRYYEELETKHDMGRIGYNNFINDIKSITKNLALTPEKEVTLRKIVSDRCEIERQANYSSGCIAVKEMRDEVLYKMVSFRNIFRFVSCQNCSEVNLILTRMNELFPEIPTTLKDVVRVKVKETNNMCSLGVIGLEYCQQSIEYRRILAIMP